MFGNASTNLAVMKISRVLFVGILLAPTGVQFIANSDPAKNIVGPESAGMRAGLARFTKIMFGASYINGRPGILGRGLIPTTRR